MTKRERERVYYHPATLALLLRTAAAGLEKLQADIEVPLAVFPWLRAMVRLGSHKAAAEMDKEKKDG